jgi:hypothetical protein
MCSLEYPLERIAGHRPRVPRTPGPTAQVDRRSNWHAPCMFARYFVELPIEPLEVERLLTDGSMRWLTRLAGEAHHRGDELLAEVGFGERVRLARQVNLTLGAPIRAAEKTVIPLRWRPTNAPGLFPPLDADLEVAELAPGRTQLAMSARYDPPLGVVGKMIDRSILYRVAEATLKDFLDRLGDAIILEAGRGGSRDVLAGAD